MEETVPLSLKEKSEKNGITIEILEDFCKGCTICVDICPEDALEMVPIGSRWQGSIAVIKDINACVGCMLCELQCPDFAILVDKPARNVRKTAPAA